MIPMSCSFCNQICTTANEMNDGTNFYQCWLCHNCHKLSQVNTSFIVSKYEPSIIITTKFEFICRNINYWIDMNYYDKQCIISFMSHVGKGVEQIIIKHIPNLTPYNIIEKVQLYLTFS